MAEEANRGALEAFIRRAGFPYGWDNLESWARRMAEQAVKELAAATSPAEPAQEPAGVDALLKEVGRAMVEMTTTVRGPDEWLSIPALWKQCMEERDAARAQLAARATPTAPVAPIVEIDFKQAAELLALFGGEPTVYRLDVEGEGTLAHGGPGLYATVSEYPEDGSWFLGRTAHHARPDAPPPAEAREPLSDAEVGDMSREMVKGAKSVNWLCRQIERRLAAKWGIPLAGNTEGEKR